MFKQTPKTLKTVKALSLAAIGAIVVLAGFALFWARPTEVNAATNSTINFQARLTDNSGSIVADGVYNVEFKIYNTLTSSGSSQGSCSGDAACLWSETRTGTDRVTVANGYLTVDLGSVTGFGSSIDWSQDLYLSMRVGGTGGSPSWDPEMSPRLHLTAVPHAFTAGKLQTTSNSNSVTLEFANNFGQGTVITLPDPGASTATICYQGSASCGFLAGSATDYIQNQNASAQTTANFWISGTGRADTALQAPLFDTPTGVALNVGTTNATAINLNQNTAVAATKTFTVTSGATSLTGATTGDALTVSNSTSTGNIAVFRDNATTVATIADGGAVTFTNSVNSSAALTVEDSSGADVIVVNTSGTGSPITIGRTSPVGYTGTVLRGLYQGSSSNDQTFTVTRAVPAGSTVVGSLAISASNTPTLTITDSKLNTYSVDASIASGSVTTSYIFSSRLTTALAVGDTIRIQLSNGTGRWLVAVESFDSLLVSAVDQTATNTATSSSMTTGTSGTTTQADELVYATFGFGSGRTFTPETGFNGIAQLETSEGSNDRGMASEWKFVSSTGTQTATATISSSGVYSAALVTYKSTQPGGSLKLTNATSGYSSVLGLGSLTGNRSIVLPDESGVVCIQGATSCGFAAVSGSGNYIQNQFTAAQASSNFWISGTGRAATALQAPSFDVASAGTLSIGTTTATGITIGSNSITTTINGGLTHANGNFSSTSTGASSLTAGGALTLTGGAASTWSTTSGNLTIQAAGTSALNLTTGGAGTVALGDTNATTINIGRGSDIARTINIGNGGSTTAQTVNIGSTSSTSSTTIQGGTGASAINLTGGANGSINLTTSGTGDILLTSTDNIIAKATTGLQIQDASNAPLLYVDTANGRVGVGGQATVSKFEVLGGDAAVYNNGANPRLVLGDSTAAGQNGFLQWDSTNDYFRIESVGTNGLKINDNFVSIGNIYPGQPLIVGYGSTQLFDITTTGEVTAKTTTDSTTGFQVLDSVNNPVLNVDTDNSRIGVGTATPGYAVDVVGDVNISSGSSYRINGTAICTSSGCTPAAGSGNYIQNTTTLQSSANFIIQSAADGTNTGVIRARASQTADLLQFQNSSAGAIAGIRPSGTIWSAPVGDPNTEVPGNARLYVQPLSNTSTAIIARAAAGGAPTGDIIKLQNADGSVDLFTVGPTGAVVIKTTTDSTTGVLVRDAGNNPVFDIDTDNIRVGIGNSTPGYTLDVSGDVNISSGSSYRINGTAICTSSGCTPASGSTHYIQNGTSPQTATFNIVSGAAGSSAAQIQGAASGTVPVAIIKGGATPGANADLLQLQDSSSNVLLSVDNDGDTTIRGKLTVQSANGSALEVLGSSGGSLLTVNSATEFAANGGAETSGTFATNWTSAPAGGTITRTTSAGTFATGTAAVSVATSTTANTGVRNNLGSAPAASTTYQVSFTGKATTSNFSTLDILYSRDGGTDLETCATSQTLVTTGWTKITCTFTTDSTLATNADLIIRKSDTTARTFYIDNLSVTLAAGSGGIPAHVQIGGGDNGGQPTLFTLDRSSGAPVSGTNTAFVGSMYYDTSVGRIQCFESDGWGSCGSAPDNIIILTPEFAGATLNGTGIGTMTSDFCGNGGGLSINTTLCASGVARNFYRWTSPQGTAQTYSIYVSYKLPSTFKNFADDNTINLTARSDHATNGSVTYEVFKSTGSAITACGTATTVTTSANSWITEDHNGNENSTCAFAGSDTMIVKINMTSQSDANVYVSELTFTYTNN